MILSLYLLKIPDGGHLLIHFRRKLPVEVSCTRPISKNLAKKELLRVFTLCGCRLHTCTDSSLFTNTELIGMHFPTSMVNSFNIPTSFLTRSRISIQPCLWMLLYMESKIASVHIRPPKGTLGAVKFSTWIARTNIGVAGYDIFSTICRFLKTY